MKFSTREDIEASADEVFAAFSDFDRFERMAMRRGAEVERLDSLPHPGRGMSWRARFSYNGRPRELLCTLSEYRPDQGFDVETSAGGLSGLLTVELIALARTRTRTKVGLELRPRTFSARLFLQSLRLMKGTLDSRFRSRVHALAEDLRSRKSPI